MGRLLVFLARLLQDGWTESARDCCRRRCSGARWARWHQQSRRWPSLVSGDHKIAASMQASDGVGVFGRASASRRRRRKL